MLKGIPMTELQNTTLTLDLFFSHREIEELMDRIYFLPDLKAKFLELESFLLKRFDHNLFDERIPYAVSLLNTCEYSIDQLSHAICLSPRRFREIFSEQTGFSPAFYKKTARFNQACRQLVKSQDISLTNVAYSNNYYDQSHFNKDFSFFAGITPSQFIRQKAKSADFYNFDIENLRNFMPRT